MKKYLVPAIGALAFVIGGLIAREKTLDGIETLENKYGKKPEPALPVQNHPDIFPPQA